MNGRKGETARSMTSTLAGGCALLALAGCATKDWVETYVSEQTSPIQAQLRQVDGRVTQVDARVTQVAQQASDARKVADDGVRRSEAVNARVTKTIAGRYKRDLVESKAMQFASGRFMLEPEHKQILDGVYDMLVKNPTYTADIVGQADAPGAKKDNSLLSWRRTEHVRRYLVEKGDVIHRIAFIGIGEDLADASQRQPEHRKVTIAVFKPVMD